MLKIEEISKRHNRSKFDCGVPALNQYLKNTARQHLIKGISRTFVLTDDASPSETIGFFTLAFCEILAKELPSKYAKKYPQRVPGAKLARLAVSKKHQRQGIGALMLANAIERALVISKNMGVIGIFVDAKDESAKKYYEQFGFLTFPDNQGTLFLPLNKLREAMRY